MVQDLIKVLGDDQEPIALYQHEMDFLQKYTNKDKAFEMSCGFLKGERLVVADC